MVRIFRFLVLLLLALTCRAADPTFSEVVQRSFASWDANDDGVLSPAEIDSLVVDPTRTGADAAGIAALKLVVRGGKVTLPPLTLDFLMKPPPRRAARVDTDAEDRETRAEPRSASSQDPTAAINQRFSRALRKIKSVQRDLFLDETPDIDACRQGPLGDCFFVAAVGAAVDRDPSWVISLFTPEDAGAYSVRFGDGRSVRISPLTDAELGLTSTTGDEGLWLAMLEKAYGSLRNEGRKEEDRTESVTDAIARGGSIAATIRALTGNTVERTSLRARIERAEASGQSTTHIVEEVRAKLVAATRNRRLIGLGSDASDSGKRLPPGVSSNHAYAVLGFEESIDLVHVWNPHGNTFRPKGEEGMIHGYPTRAGRFDVPLLEFVRIFRTMTIETDTPLETRAEALQPKPAVSGSASVD